MVTTNAVSVIAACIEEIAAEIKLEGPDYSQAALELESAAAHVRKFELRAGISELLVAESRTFGNVLDRIKRRREDVEEILD